MTSIDLFDQELVRMTFIVGIAVSVMLYERTHTTTGSLVVPGYIGVQLLNPIALLATGLNALITYFLVSRLLPRFAAVYGRARFVANIVVSVMLTLVLGPVMSFATGPSIPVLDSIGYVIPALIAYDMNRQGVAKTGAAVTVAGAMAAVPALLIVALAPQVVEETLPLNTGLLAVGDAWFPIVALVSTGVSTALQSNHNLRSGGFVGPMYLGLSAVHPEQLVFFAVLAVLIYSVVEFGLKPAMIIFGRRKFAVVLMFGSLLSWTVLQLLVFQWPTLLAIANLPIAALFVPALLANDMERTSVADVFVGGYIAATATLSITVVLASVVDQTDRPWWAIPMLLTSVSVLFWPSARPARKAASPSSEIDAALA